MAAILSPFFDPKTLPDGVAAAFTTARASGHSITFRSGAYSLYVQGVNDNVRVNTRREFQQIEVLDSGACVRVQPGGTVRQTNTRPIRHGRKRAPDPASTR